MIHICHFLRSNALRIHQNHWIPLVIQAFATGGAKVAKTQKLQNSGNRENHKNDFL